MEQSTARYWVTNIAFLLLGFIAAALIYKEAVLTISQHTSTVRAMISDINVVARKLSEVEKKVNAAAKAE